ncbi:MAG: methyltransferase domain-containing protein [Geminicoccaceae bacterium]|nr:MAG: methyltransferase domain-containing protein [Geminicoccaceae bacterium]
MADAGWRADALLGGRLRLSQPPTGYRIAIDPILLQAAVDPSPGGHVLDLGAGVGGAALPLAWRRPDLVVFGLERNADLAAAMVANAQRNGLEDRVLVVRGDVASPPFRRQAFDAVMTNPPFMPASRATSPGTVLGRQARQENQVTLAAWIAAAAALVRPGGQLVVVHRADRLGELAAALAPSSGGLELLPLWPKRGRPAKRVLVRAWIGRNRPSRVLAGLVLHGPDDHFTGDADRILRDGEPLRWE